MSGTWIGQSRKMILAALTILVVAAAAGAYFLFLTPKHVRDWSGVQAFWQTNWQNYSPSKVFVTHDSQAIYLKMDYVPGTGIDRSAHFFAAFYAADRYEYPPDPTVKVYGTLNTTLYLFGQTELVKVADVEFILSESSCEWRIPLSLIPEISSRLSSGQKIVVQFLIENAQGSDFGNTEPLQYPP
jgi:hypothetical protein